MPNYLTIEKSLICRLQGCVSLGQIGKIGKIRLRNVKLDIFQQTVTAQAGGAVIFYKKKPSNFSFDKAVIVSHPNRVRVELFSRKLSRNRAWPCSRDVHAGPPL